MSFVFTFQKVLDVKEKEVEIAQQEYGSIKQQQTQLEKQMKQLEDSKDHVFNQYNDVDRKTVWEILEFQQEIDHVNRQMKQLTFKKQEVHQQVEKHQQELIEKSKEAKIWNQWKAKSKETFEQLVNQKEQAMLDEMAVLRHSRRL